MKALKVRTEYLLQNPGQWDHEGSQGKNMYSSADFHSYFDPDSQSVDTKPDPTKDLT
jgi:hypothetical protein